MATDNSTKAMIAAYVDNVSPTPFLSGFFRTPPQNYYSSENVTFDIRRNGAYLAVAVESLNAGARQNELSKFTNKEFAPPVFKEEGTINAFDLLKRVPGINPFQDPDYNASAITQAFQVGRLCEEKIRRSIELMCAQIFQTGVVTLKDENNVALYTLDFQAKNTHFATVSTSWATSTTIIADINNHANLIWTDGKVRPNRLIFGKTAIVNFMHNPDIIALVNKLGINLGSYQPPAVNGAGGIYHGMIPIGQYNFEIWSYDSFYNDPANSDTPTPYITDDYVIFTSSDARYDLTFGNVPLIGSIESQAIPFLPPRISDSASGVDIIMNSYITLDREHLKVRASCRPLPIPTAIDTFGRLDTVP